MSKKIKEVLIELEKCQKICKERYWEYVKEDPKLASSFSCQAAAYEYAHILISKAIGVNSKYEFPYSE